MKISSSPYTNNFLLNKKTSCSLQPNSVPHSAIDSLPQSKCSTKSNKSTISFGSIYVEDTVNYGKVAEKGGYSSFLKKDALLLNEIAQAYPNQDCFIRRANNILPCLAYREKPPQVETFSENLAKRFTTSFDPNDEDYPVEHLILYPDTKLNRFFGVTSYISLNPSLPYTVKVGYELHKKLIEKKNQIKQVIGKTDNAYLGEESINKKAHKAIEDVETAVTRYLLECSFAALTDRASAEQIYQSNYPKVQTRLSLKRKYDLETSTAQQSAYQNEQIDKLKDNICAMTKDNCSNPDDITKKIEEEFNKLDRDDKKIDIIDYVMKIYPNTEENKARIDTLSKYMETHNIYL